MHPMYVIKRPLLTEKSTEAMNTGGHYTFEVDRTATKTDVKKAIESLYGVRVHDVNTQVRKGKERRMRFGWVSEKVTKKATVRLHPEDTIELF